MRAESPNDLTDREHVWRSYEAHQQEGEEMRVVMEPLLLEASVDVVFAGHVHAYERCTRVDNYQVKPSYRNLLLTCF